MRRPALLALLAMVVLAGCAAPLADGTANGSQASADGPADQRGDTATDGGSTVAPGTPGPAPADDGDGDPPTTEQPDPDEDRLGWEAGYWYNDPLAVDNSDGLDATEREAVIARAMARVELIRGLEFREPVDVTVVSRDEFSAGDLGGEDSEALGTFDNAKFEALLLVGGEADSMATQDDSLNATVGGYYSSEREAIVLVSESATPTVDGEGTLIHELVHAAQDQHFQGLGSQARFRDAYNGRNGLIEGDANAVQQSFDQRCDAAWRCIESPDEGGPGSGGDTDLHMGVYLLEFFPYADGPGLIAHLRDGGNWSAVNDAYRRAPTSARGHLPRAVRQFRTRGRRAGRQQPGRLGARPPARAARLRPPGPVGTGGDVRLFPLRRLQPERGDRPRRLPQLRGRRTRPD
jgi:hypothetical protein